MTSTPAYFLPRVGFGGSPRSILLPTASRFLQGAQKKGMLRIVFYLLSPSCLLR